MAGDWIKIELTLPDKPEVIRMASLLKIDQDAVSGKLLRVWIWADQNSVDGEHVPITTAFLDRMVDKKGFANAMRSVGWLNGDDGQFLFPNFDRHNGTTAKARCESNRRMAKSRAARNKGDGDVTEKPQQKPQPEKRRERASKDTPPLPPEGEKSQSVEDAPHVGDETQNGSGRIANLPAIKARINGLRPEWAKPAVWNYAEEHMLFGGSAAQLEEMTATDWDLLRRYLSTRMPEGATYWQPRNRAKFVETFSSVFADAQRWESRQRRTPPPTAAPAPIAPRSVISRDQLSTIFGNPAA